MTANIYGSCKQSASIDINDILNAAHLHLEKIIPKHRNDSLISINESIFRENALRGNGHTLLSKTNREKFVGI
jgi:hypothetical protein